jgi:hypothetical protein
MLGGTALRTLATVSLFLLIMLYKMDTDIEAIITQPFILPETDFLTVFNLELKSLHHD